MCVCMQRNTYVPQWSNIVYSTQCSTNLYYMTCMEYLVNIECMLNRCNVPNSPASLAPPLTQTISGANKWWDARVIEIIQFLRILPLFLYSKYTQNFTSFMIMFIHLMKNRRLAFLKVEVSFYFNHNISNMNLYV